MTGRSRMHLRWRTVAPGGINAHDTVVCDEHQDPWLDAVALLGVVAIPTLTDDPCWQCVESDDASSQAPRP